MIIIVLQYVCTVGPDWFFDAVLINTDQYGKKICSTLEFYCQIYVIFVKI